MYWFFYEQPFDPDRKVLAKKHKKEVEEERIKIRKLRIQRMKSERALIGRLNVEIIYESGTRHEGRMRRTTDGYAVIEPNEGDTRAWLCNLEDVRDLRIINLLKVPNTPIVHTPKNIAWLKSMSYFNKYDF